MLEVNTLIKQGRNRFLGMAVYLSAALCFSSVATAQSVVAVDVYNKKIHVERGASVKRPVGGLTKVATALVALDWAEVTKVPLNTLATISPSSLQIAGLNSMNLQPGDQVTLRDLIYSTMMTSDNVAATTLAAFVGQDILSRRGRGGDPIAAFVSEMNKLAAREGMSSTRFTNPHGLENSRTAPYSTAADLAKLAMYAASRAPFRFYTTQKNRDITVLRMGQPQKITLQNTNALLGIGGIDGMKTGNTPQSGGCIIATEERQGTLQKNQQGQSVLYRHRMVVVVLGSADPFGEARGLLQQGWASYDNWLRQGRPITTRQELLASFE